MTKANSTTCAGNDWPGRKAFALILAALFALAYPGLLIGRHTLFFRDFGVISYPVIAYQHDAFWRGVFPLWNPLSHCGAPMLAQWGTMTLYPFSLIYLLLPLPWSLSLFWMAHLYLGGMGMYSLALRYQANSFAASLAGVVFVFNGLIASSLAWPNYSVALGWMPWVILASERTWLEGGRMSIWAALTGAMQMLSGVPEVILLTWGLLSVLWVREWWIHPGIRGRIALRQVLLVAWVAALCAAQLLPFLELISRSQRSEQFGGGGWSMPWWGWASLLTPLLNCAVSPQGVYYQPRHIFITSYYLGIAWMPLALLGALFSSVPRRRILFVATGFALLFALGDDGLLYPLLKKLAPQIGYARYPIKVFYLAAFCLPLLAASGSSALLSREEKDRLAQRRFRWVLAITGAGVLGLIFAARFSMATSAMLPEMTLNSVIRLLILGGVGGLILWMAGDRPGRDNRLARALVLGLLWLDANTYAPNLVPTVMAPALARQSPAMSHPPVPGLSRAMVSAYAEKRLYASRVPGFFDDLMGKRLGLWANLNLIDEVPKVDGGLTLQIREESEVESALRVDPTNDYPRLLDFLGVSQITAPGKIIEWEERATAQPWVTCGQRPSLVPFGETLAAILSPKFSPSKSVILEPSAQKEFAGMIEEPRARATLDQFSDQKLEIQVEAPRETIVVVAQSFHPNWTAQVDGKQEQIWRANHAFQAVKVSAGSHRLILRYVDRQFRIGLAISLAALAALVGLASRNQGAVPGGNLTDGLPAERKRRGCSAPLTVSPFPRL